MSKKKANMAQEKQFKAADQTELTLKINLSTYQYTLISQMMYIISGSTRFDQLSDILYESLEIISKLGIRPLFSTINATYMERLNKLTGDTQGTSISGEGRQRFLQYKSCLGRMFSDQFLSNMFSDADLIISILLIHISYFQDERLRFSKLDRRPSVTYISYDRRDVVYLAILDMWHGLCYDSEMYNLNEFALQVLSQSVIEFQTQRTNYVLDAIRRIDQGINVYANSTFLRLRSMNALRDKTEKRVFHMNNAVMSGSDDDSPNMMCLDEKRSEKG